eukprot:365287-Chlamydomonas_euryale.AAC.8
MFKSLDRTAAYCLAVMLLFSVRSASRDDVYSCRRHRRQREAERLPCRRRAVRPVHAWQRPRRQQRSCQPPAVEAAGVEAGGSRVQLQAPLGVVACVRGKGWPRGGNRSAGCNSGVDARR